MFLAARQGIFAKPAASNQSALLGAISKQLL
jgi:hypothetical protein